MRARGVERWSSRRRSASVVAEPVPPAPGARAGRRRRRPSDAIAARDQHRLGDRRQVGGQADRADALDERDRVAVGVGRSTPRSPRAACSRRRRAQTPSRRVGLAPLTTSTASSLLLIVTVAATGCRAAADGVRERHGERLGGLRARRRAIGTAIVLSRLARREVQRAARRACSPAPAVAEPSAVANWTRRPRADVAAADARSIDRAARSPRARSAAEEAKRVAVARRRPARRRRTSIENPGGRCAPRVDGQRDRLRARTVGVDLEVERRRLPGAATTEVVSRAGRRPRRSRAQVAARRWRTSSTVQLPVPHAQAGKRRAARAALPPSRSRPSTSRRRAVAGDVDPEAARCRVIDVAAAMSTRRAEPVPRTPSAAVGGDRVAGTVVSAPSGASTPCAGVAVIALRGAARGPPGVTPSIELPRCPRPAAARRVRPRSRCPVPRGRRR